MGENGKKRSILRRAASGAERFLDEGAIWIAIAAGIGLALLQAPGVNELAENIGLSTSGQLRTGIFALLLTSILYELRRVKRSVTPAIGRQHFVTAQDMYTVLDEKAKAIVDPSHQSLDVLGLTLYIAWPMLALLLQRAEVNQWTVRLAILGHDADASESWVPSDWREEAASMVKQVEQFKQGEGARHNHQIDIYRYKFSPAVHGFRLGNGDVFISTLLWLEDGWLSKSGFAYDYVPWNDTSPWAAGMRALFENWFDQALASDGNGEVERAPSPDAERTV